MATMTEPKKKRPRRGRPPVAEPRHQITGFRGRAGFAAWFDGFVQHERLPKATLIEHALIEYARMRGYKPKPPER